MEYNCSSREKNITHTYIHTYIHTHIHTYKRIYIHTHTHTHTHNIYNSFIPSVMTFYIHGRLKFSFALITVTIFLSDVYSPQSSNRRKGKFVKRVRF
jgi:hypothetical protein